MGDSSKGRLIIVSGPSGAGKTTVLKEVFARCPRLVSSVSATTRAPRPGEVNGVDYYFLSPEEFAARKKRGDFLECFEVFGSGHWYGTLESEVGPRLATGNWVVLEIDVDGTLAVLAKYPDAVTIFVRPESIEDLERRLRLRGTESEAAIERRLAVARRELGFVDRYRYVVRNQSVEEAVADILRILKGLENVNDRRTA
jgi:guanylate kinase